MGTIFNRMTQVHISRNAEKLFQDKEYARKVIDQIIIKKEGLDKGEDVLVLNEKTNENSTLNLVSD